MSTPEDLTKKLKEKDTATQPQTEKPFSSEGYSQHGFKGKGSVRVSIEENNGRVKPGIQLEYSAEIAGEDIPKFLDKGILIEGHMIFASRF